MSLGARIVSIPFLLFAVLCGLPAIALGTWHPGKEVIEGTVIGEKRLRELTDSLSVLLETGSDAPGKAEMASEIEAIISGDVIKDYPSAV